MGNINSFLAKAWERTVTRFLCVGMFNTILDFSILNILVSVAGFTVLLANTISTTIGISISYFLNHHIVFRRAQKPSLKNYSKFFLVTGLSVLIIQNLILFASSKLGIANSENTVHLLLFNVQDKTVVLNTAKALAILVGMVWNFTLYKYVIFNDKSKEKIEDEFIVG